MSVQQKHVGKLSLANGDKMFFEFVGNETRFLLQGWANYGQPNVFKQPSKITPYSCYVERK